MVCSCDGVCVVSHPFSHPFWAPVFFRLSVDVRAHQPGTHEVEGAQAHADDSEEYQPVVGYVQQQQQY